MKIALMNGSPKVKESASAIILKDFGSLLEGQEILLVGIHKPTINEDILSQILDCDALVFAFPLYVDGIPSHLLSVLETIEAAARKVSSEGKKRMVYTMVNCGFYESKQNSIGIELIQNFSKRSGFVFGQGIGFGAGGMIGSLEKVPPGAGPKRNYGAALLELSENVKKGQTGDTLYPKMNFPKFLYQQAAQFGMRKTAKHNGCKRRDLNKRL